MDDGALLRSDRRAEEKGVIVVLIIVVLDKDMERSST